MKSHQTNSNRLATLAAVAIFAILLAGAVLPARADQDWDGDNSTGNFGFNNNWYGDNQPGWSDLGNLTFHSNNGSESYLYDDYGIWVNTMNMYYASTYPRAMTLSGSGNGLYIHCRLENDSSYDQTISIPLDMLGDRDANNVQINPVNANLTLNGTLSNDNSKDLNVYGTNGKMLTLNTAWPNNNYGVKLLLQQNSIVNITASQNYTGETDINAGEFWVSTGGALSTSRIYVGDGGAVTTTAKMWLHDGSLSISTPITVNNGNNNTRTVGGLNTGGTVTYSGTVTLNGPVNLEANQAGGTVSFSTISAGSVQTATATGPGTVMLGGTADNINLALTVNSGTVQLNKSVAGGTHAEGSGLTINNTGTVQLGTSSAGDEIYDSSDVTVSSGGVFDLNGQSETIRNFSLSGTGISSGGALINNNGSTTSTLTASGGTTLGADSSIGGSANITLPNAISGAHNLIKTGSGKVTLSAASGRTTTAGTTQIDNGVLRIQNGTALNTLNTTVTTINNGGVLELNGGITLDQPITFNNGATLRSDGNNNNNGKVTVSSAASASVTLATVSSGDTFTIGNGANDISGGASSSTIHITGPGTTLLSQSSDYIGNWSVDAGTLLLQSSTADLGATIASTLTLNGGSLKLNYSALQTFVAGAGSNVAVTATSTMISDRTASTANGLIYTFGNLSINGSQLNIVGGANVTGGSYPAGITFGATTLSGNPTFNISNPTAGGSTLLTLGAVNNGANTVTLKGNGKFAQTGVWGTGAGGLTLDATYTGTATLNQVNTYTGNTTINGGTLQIGDGTTDGSISSSSSIADNAALSYNLVGSQTYANAISGTGSLGKGGAGALTLSGNNTYSGGTTVSNGTLRVNGQTGSNSGTGSGTVAVNGGTSGGTLSGNGRIAGNVTVASSSTAVLYPNSGSTLTFGGNLTVGSSSVVEFDLSSSASGANDKVVLENKTLTFGTSTRITINSAGTLDSSDYVLFDAGSSGTISGTYNSVPAWSGTTPKYSSHYSIVTVGKTIVLRYTPIPITVTAAANSKTYDGTTSAAGTPTVTSGSLDAADTGTWTETYITKDAGTGNKTLTPSGTVKDAGNNDVTSRYNITFSSFTTGTIIAKALTVSGITAGSTTYDGTTTAKLGGTAAFQSTEAAGAGTTSDGKPYNVDSVSPGGTAAGALAAKDVGTQVVTITGVTVTGTGSGNYTVTQQTGLTQNVTAKALTAVGTLVFPASKVYDGAATATPTSGSAALQTAETTGNGTTSDGISYTGNGDAVSLAGTASYNYNSKDVASATTVTESGLSLTGTGSGNYSLTPPSFSKTITALAVGLFGTRNYDGTTGASSTILTVTNKIGSDTVTVASGSGTLASANGGSQTISSFGNLALGNNSAGDYTLTGASGSVRINPAPGSFSISTTTNKPVTFAASKVIHYASDAGVTLSISAVASPSTHGTVGLSGGNITYTPTADYAGSDSFTYTLSDDAGGSSSGTVNVTVSGANVGPSLTAVVNGGFATITTSGMASQTYKVQISADGVTNWTDYQTTTAGSNGLVSWTDSDAVANHGSRFYRLAQQ